MWVAHFDQRNTTPDIDPQAVLRTIAQQALTTTAADEKLLAASMLGVPSELYLFEQLQEFEVDALLDARDSAVRAVATEHTDVWAELYQKFSVSDAFSVDADSMANRALANSAFSYLCHGLAVQHKVEALSQLIEQRYAEADNLTNRRAVLSLACRLPELNDSIRQRILRDFYTRWESQALVIDLWFNVQAQSPLTDLAALRQLTSHPGFDLKNPNRVRSVYGAFGMLNLRRLHALDGSGYEFVAAAVAEMDALNPQIAARLATPLTRWKKFDPQRQRLMRDALSGLLTGKAQDPSKDLFEIVSKSRDV
jgi:aminopeptidase N